MEFLLSLLLLNKIEEEKILDEELQKTGEQSEDIDNEPFEAPQPTGKVVGIIKRNWRQYVA